MQIYKESLPFVHCENQIGLSEVESKHIHLFNIDFPLYSEFHTRLCIETMRNIFLLKIIHTLTLNANQKKF